VTVERVHFPPVDVNDMRVGFAHLESEVAFWQSHRNEYLDRFPDEFLAVALGGDVIAHSRDLVEFDQLMRAAGFERRHTFESFLEKTPIRLIL
jgi:hypothetical protein